MSSRDAERIFPSWNAVLRILNQLKAVIRPKQNPKESPDLRQSEGLAARGYFIPGGTSQRGVGQAPAFRVAHCQTWTGVRPKIGRKLININQQLSKSTKVKMLKSGDVNFEFGFEW